MVKKLMRSEADYLSTFTNVDDDEITKSTESSYDDYMDESIEKKLKAREKLKIQLARAKNIDDKALIQEIEKKLGVVKMEPQKPSPVSETSKTIDETIKVLTNQLTNPDLDDNQHNRIVRTLQSFMMLKGGKDFNLQAFQASMPSTRPSEPKQDKATEILIDLAKTMITRKTDETGKTEMEKMADMQKFIAENTPSLAAQLKDAKELMKETGHDVDGEKTLQSMQFALDKLKIDNDFSLRKEEIDAKKEQNKMMGGWLKELSGAAIEAMVDTIGDEEEETKTEKKTEGKEPKPEGKIKSIRCVNCHKSTDITDPSKSREIVCSHCSWPHAYDGDTGKFSSILPDVVRQELDMEPEEFLKDYKEGDITQFIKDQSQKKEAVDQKN